MANVVHIESVKDSSLEERIAVYSESWVNGSNKREAYEAAGYSSATFSNAANFHKRYKKEIDKEILGHLGNKVPLALDTLVSVMVSSQSDTARVKAALEVMDRAGFDKQTRISIDHQDPKNKEELQKELATLLALNPNIGVLS
jgi:hypothetical protein|tara:strand:+ start:648 stop:1076 length:429 start_codon:yes stop_codon:yes gene_type:complete